MARTKKEEQGIPPWPLTGMPLDSSNWPSKPEKKNPKKKGSSSPSMFSKSSKLTCRKCGSSKNNCDDYKFGRQNKERKGVKTIKPVNKGLTKAFGYNIYCPVKQCKEYKGQSLGKVQDKPSMDAQMKSTSLSRRFRYRLSRFHTNLNRFAT